MKKLTFFSTLVVAGAMLFGSCDKQTLNRETPSDKSECTLSAESFLMDSQGNLTPLPVSTLRADVENEKGKISGLGKYYTGQTATVTATAKAPYRLLTLYVKDDPTFTYEAGMTTTASTSTITKVANKSCTIKLVVSKSVRFVAIYTNADTTRKAYGIAANEQKTSLVVEGNQEHRVLNNLGFQEYTAIVKGDGKVALWEKTAEKVFGWEILRTNKQNWLVVEPSASTGEITFRPHSYRSKTGGSRSETIILIKKPGVPTSGDLNVTLADVRRQVVFTQNSYYDSADNVSDIDKIQVGSDTAVDSRDIDKVIPPTLTWTFNPNGETKDITTLHKSFKQPVKVIIPVYKNGKKTGETVTKTMTVEFGNPSGGTWLTKTGNNYKTTANAGEAVRNGSVTVTFKVDGKPIRTTTVRVSQEAITYEVSGEIQ